MAQSDWIKRTEAERVTQAQDVSAKLTASSAAYFLTSSECTLLAGLVATFVSKYNLATDPTTRTEITVDEKNASEDAMLAVLRAYGRRISVNPSIPDSLKLAIGLSIRQKPSPIPAPSTKPLVNITSTSGLMLNVRVADQNTPNKRAKAPHTAGVEVFYFVGAEAPADLGGYRFEGLATKSPFAITRPAGTTPGSKVWVVCRWYSARGEVGPISDPVSALVAGGVSAPSSEAV